MVGGAPETFYTDVLNNVAWLANPPPMPGGFRSNRPIERLYDAIGSVTNNEDFLFLGGSMNRLKYRVLIAFSICITKTNICSYGREIGLHFTENRMWDWIRLDPGVALSRLRDVSKQTPMFDTMLH